MKERVNQDGLYIILGTVPVIAVTNSLLNALGIAIATMLVLFFTSIIYLFFAKYTNEPTRTFILLLIASTMTTILNIFLSWLIPDLHANLSLFLPLIAVNSFLVYGLKNYNEKQSKIGYTINLVKRYFGCFTILCASGAISEIIGRGTLLNQPLILEDSNELLLVTAQSPIGAFMVNGIFIFIYYKLKVRNE